MKSQRYKPFVRVIGLILAVLMILAVVMLAAMPAWATSGGTDLQSVRDSVLRVVVRDEKDTIISLGSGFAIGTSSPISYIITSYHVVEANQSNICVWLSKDQFVKCSVYTSLPNTDIAVLKAENPIYRNPLPIGLSDTVKAGDEVYAYGFSTNDISDFLTSYSTDVTITNGVVSKMTKWNNIRYYQTTAAINEGNSGGPLYHKDGYVIGINTIKLEGSENTAGAIMVEEIVDALDNMGISYTLASAASAGVTGGKLWIVLFVLGCVCLVVVLGILLWQYFKQNSKASSADGKPVAKPAQQLWERLVGSGGRNGEEAEKDFGPSLRPMLNCLSGPYAGTSLEMEGTVAIGRETRICQLVYPPDASEISRVHCIVRFEARQKRFILEDRSSNGTYLMNGTRLAPNVPTPIQPGDRFYLADIGNLYEVKLEA